MEPWTGIADADAHLGRAFPLPAVTLPLARWVEVRPSGAGAEVEWNLDDTRAGTPAPPRAVRRRRAAARARVGRRARGRRRRSQLRTVALEQAEPSLRPAHELRWVRDDLHLRLTAQGPWERDG